VKSVGEKIHVCARFFRKLFSIGQTRVNTISKFIASGKGTSDKRGGDHKIFCQRHTFMKPPLLFNSLPMNVVAKIKPTLNAFSCILAHQEISAKSERSEISELLLTSRVKVERREDVKKLLRLRFGEDWVLQEEPSFFKEAMDLPHATQRDDEEHTCDCLHEESGFCNL
ncbi:hypothetical protein ANN_11393, partial [Periplaneta americana]